ncbi:MAG: hypothetical protein KU29_07410 [Sulfurovum sp. FS06-10]|nr:MAG: hypothetical protein KU29_07410 [Sulfurovum sp. FS06-10]
MSKRLKLLFDDIEKMFPESKDNGFFKAMNIYSKSYEEYLNFNEFKVYHYTDINALIHIVHEQGLWLSNLKYLNDKDEILNGAKIAIDLIHKLLNKTKYIKDKSKIILEKVLLLLNEKNTKDYYICSFSLKADDLEQWRAYGKNGSGVCIEFDKKNKNYTLFNIGNFLIWHKVIYDDNKKYRFIHSIIFRYLYYAKGSFINEKFTIDDYAEVLYRKITYSFVYFKHRAFESENEIRLVYEPRDVEELKKDFAKLHFRESKNMIVPFIKTNEHKLKSASANEYEDKQLLPVSKIIVGPTANGKVTVDSIRELLKFHQYQNVTVEESIVPFR